MVGKYKDKEGNVLKVQHTTILRDRKIVQLKGLEIGKLGGFNNVLFCYITEKELKTKIDKGELTKV